MQETITIRPTIRKSQLKRLSGGNLNKWINGLIERAVRENQNGSGRQESPHGVQDSRSALMPAKDCNWEEFLKRPRRLVKKYCADEMRDAER